MPEEPPPSLITLTHVIYALHAVSLVATPMIPMIIVGAFLTGWPSIIAVILNYLRRSEVAGTDHVVNHRVGIKGAGRRFQRQGRANGDAFADEPGGGLTLSGRD